MSYQENGRSRAPLPTTVNKAVYLKTLEFRDTFGGVPRNDEVGIIVTNHSTSGTKELAINCTREEVAKAPQVIRDILGRLGINGKEPVAVGIRLAAGEDPDEQIGSFSLTLQPGTVAPRKYGVSLSFSGAEILAKGQDAEELDPKYNELVDVCSQLWVVKPGRNNHHPLKAEILGAAHGWIKQVVEGRNKPANHPVTTIIEGREVLV